MGYIPKISEYSVFPNLPSSPWSFNPVNVFAIFQNFIWLIPAKIIFINVHKFHILENIKETVQVVIIN